MMQFARTLLDVLFASCWQDAIVLLIALAVLASLGRRLSSATRHAILQLALYAMVFVPIATTLPHLASAQVFESGHGVAGATGAAGSAHAAWTIAARRIDFILKDGIVAGLIVFWAAGVLWFGLRMAASVVRFSRIVAAGKQIAVRGGVPVYASEKIGVPFAAGLVAQKIIVPADLANAQPSQFTCVVLHELAHLRRGDTWLHAIERVCQALLFFNPAVPALLKAIAFEREAACDDWASLHARDAQEYTRTLAVLALRRSFAPDAAACGAIGFGHATVRRIQRLEDPRHNGSIHISHSAIGGFLFMIATLAISLQLLAPAIAFSPQSGHAQSIAAASNCSREVSVTTPAQPPSGLPQGQAIVNVSVSASGTVTGAKIAKSSGNAAFDAAAVRVAKQSTYAPAIRNCKPVAGTYRFMLSTH